jgi:hypothetical protein
MNMEDIPPYAQSTAARIELMGFTRWSFDEDARLPDLTKRLQVRDEASLAPRAEVTRYAASLKRGDLMPPIIMTKDEYLVDGATRIAAALRAKRSHFPAFYLNVNFTNAPQPVLDELTMLGTAFNMTHGNKMNRADVERVIQVVSHEGDSPRDIANRLGNVSESTVRSVINARSARTRAADLGIELNGETYHPLTQTHLARLGDKAKQFNNQVFKEFITLIRDTGMSTTDAENLSRRLTVQGDDDSKLALIQAERDSRPYGSSRPSRAGKLRQSLGYSLKFADQPDLLIETSQEAAPVHRQVIHDAIAALQLVERAQFNLDRSREE